MSWCDGTYIHRKWAGAVEWHFPENCVWMRDGCIFEPVQELKNYRTEPSELVSETAGRRGDCHKEQQIIPIVK